MGGAERVVTRLANYWASQGHDVAIATIYPLSSDFYQLHSQVRRFAFDLAIPSKSKLGTVIQILKRHWAIYKTIRQFNPDAAISFMTFMNVMALMVQPFIRTPIIISERTNPDRQNISKGYRRLRRLLYPLVRKMVVVSHGVAEAYPWLPAHKKAVVYNPCDAILPDVERMPTKTIVTLGRLVSIKGHDLLIEAFSRIAGKHPNWTLKIYGEGPYRAHLESCIAVSPYASRITLEGHITDTVHILANAGLFVLSSQHEGFPNALIEAMSAGLPVISFDCPFGPKEIITHGHDGLLVPPQNIDELAKAMDGLIDDPALRETLSANALAITDRLSIQSIASQWERIITEVTHNR